MGVFFVKISKFIALALAAALSVTYASSCAAGENPPQSQDGASVSATDDALETRMSAMEIAQDMGIGINLGNTFDAYYEDKQRTSSGAQIIGDNTPTNYETCWGSVQTTKEIIDAFKDAGFNTIRIPVYWGNMMEEDGTYTISEDYIARVAEVAQWVLDDEMYCVINMHHYDGHILTALEPDEALEVVDTLWTQIAEYFKDYPDKLVLEGFNESLGSTPSYILYTEDELFEYVNELNSTFVNAVRSTGSENADRMLIISGYNTNIDKTTDPRFTLPADTADDRLMVSVHYVDNAMYWSNQLGTQQWYDYSISQCELLKSAFSDKGIPVFIGECTSVKSYNSPDRIPSGAVYSDPLKMFKTEMDIITDYGFVPVVWDTANDWFNRSECRFNSAEDGDAVKDIAQKISDRSA